MVASTHLTALASPDQHGDTAPLRRVPWIAARCAYEVARDAELASADDDEGARLADLLSNAEDVLMAIPSPDAAAFAFKCVVARGDGRQTDCWDVMLDAEAKRFAGVEGR